MKIIWSNNSGKDETNKHFERLRPKLWGIWLARSFRHRWIRTCASAVVVPCRRRNPRPRLCLHAFRLRCRTLPFRCSRRRRVWARRCAELQVRLQKAADAGWYCSRDTVPGMEPGWTNVVVGVVAIVWAVEVDGGDWYRTRQEQEVQYHRWAATGVL